MNEDKQIQPMNRSNSVNTNTNHNALHEEWIIMTIQYPHTHHIRVGSQDI